MTLIEPVTKKCAICGVKNKYFEVMSTNTFGYPDLDSRPSEMSRSTMNLWIQKCPRCGYCSADVSKGEPSVKDIIETEQYKAQLSNANFPELANSFLCSSIINISQ